MLKIRESLASWGALAATGSTLMCCALPALLVSLGAGASLAGIIGLFPQLIWLSTHKLVVFGVAGLLLGITAYLQMRPAVCPTDPTLASHCGRLRRTHRAVLWVATSMYTVGVFFALVLPWMLS